MGVSTGGGLQSVLQHRLQRMVLAAACVYGCNEASAPLPANRVVTITPDLVASFASLDDVHALAVAVTDTLGNPVTGSVAWEVAPATAAVSVSGGGVTITSAAPARDYHILATVDGVSDTAVVRVLPRPTGKLVFSTSADGQGRVFVKDFASPGDATSIASGPGTIAGLAVDQVSSRIFFARGSLPNADIYRVEVDGSSLSNVTNDASASNQGPAINPVTHDVYFSRRGLSGTATQVFRMGQDGTSLSEVTAGTQGKVQPSVSTDGLRLAWSETYPGFNLEVVTATIGGSNPVRLTDRSGFDAQPHWLTNGTVAWSAALTTQPDVFVADAPGGSNARNLTSITGRSSQPSTGCAPNTLTILRVLTGETAAYHLDVPTGLVVKYSLPVVRTITFARRLC